jgi:hypothetical protein
MSIYGPRISLPKFKMPKITMPAKKGAIKIVAGILIMLIIIFVLTFALTYNPTIQVAWSQNPIDLKEENSITTLYLTLINSTDLTQDISLEVTTNSEELIIFCPDKYFENVSPGNRRETSCLIRRNPDKKIFAGDYTIEIKTNLGETKTILGVRTN